MAIKPTFSNKITSNLKKKPVAQPTPITAPQTKGFSNNPLVPNNKANAEATAQNKALLNNKLQTQQGGVAPQAPPTQNQKNNPINKVTHKSDGGAIVEKTNPLTGQLVTENMSANQYAAYVDISRDTGSGGEQVGGINRMRDIEAANETQTMVGRKAQQLGIEQQAQAQLNAPAMAEQQAIINQMGLTPDQIAAVQSGLVQAPVDFGQAATAGTLQNVPGLIQNIGVGAAAGAGLGSVVPGLGTAVGAVAGGALGALKSVYGGVQGNIKQQQQGEIQASNEVLTVAKTNMRKLSALAAKDPGNSQKYVEAYDQQLAQVYRAQAKIKLETTGNLNRYMEDGTDILSGFDLFLAPGGQADLSKQQLQMALMSGIAPELDLEDFG